jgi:hypothetical protein
MPNIGIEDVRCPHRTTNPLRGSAVAHAER